MIHFFRHIRQSLLRGNKFRKYTLYALGEILLVITGILIALFINDWRNEKQLQNNEQEVLESLQLEFEETKKQIETFITGSEEIVETAKSFIVFCSEADETINNAIFDSLLHNTAWQQTLSLNQGVLNELFNTGKLSIISDRPTRTLLSNWTALSTQAKSSNKNSLDYINTMVVELLDKKISWNEMLKYDKNNPLTLHKKKRNIDRYQLAKDIRIENFAINQMWFTDAQVKSAQRLLNLNNDILDQISRSLTEN